MKPFNKYFDHTLLRPDATREDIRTLIDEALKYDFAAVHLEAPDECTHCHDLPGKLEAIARLDADIVAPIVNAMRAKGEDFRMLILSDHKTLMSDGSHDGTPVPFLLYDSRSTEGSGLSYTEENGEKGPFLPDGTVLMSMLFEA